MNPNDRFSKTLTRKDTGEAKGHDTYVVIPIQDADFFPRLDSRKRCPSVPITVSEHRGDNSWKLRFCRFSNAKGGVQYRLRYVESLLRYYGLCAGDELLILKQDGRYVVPAIQGSGERREITKRRCPISQDDRQAALDLLKQGFGVEEVAAAAQVSLSTVYHWKRRAGRLGSEVAPPTGKSEHSPGSVRGDGPVRASSDGRSSRKQKSAATGRKGSAWKITAATKTLTATDTGAVRSHTQGINVDLGFIELFRECGSIPEAVTMVDESGHPWRITIACFGRQYRLTGEARAYLVHNQLQPGDELHVEKHSLLGKTAWRISHTVARVPDEQACEPPWRTSSKAINGHKDRLLRGVTTAGRPRAVIFAG